MKQKHRARRKRHGSSGFKVEAALRRSRRGGLSGEWLRAVGRCGGFVEPILLSGSRLVTGGLGTVRLIVLLCRLLVGMALVLGQFAIDVEGGLGLGGIVLLQRLETRLADFLMPLEDVGAVLGAAGLLSAKLLGLEAGLRDACGCACSENAHGARPFVGASMD